MKTYDTINIDHELSMWKNEIESIIAKFNRLPSGKKAKLMGNIMEIHILAAELESRIAELKEGGYDGGAYWDRDLKIDIDAFRNDFTESSGMYMDYDYSG